MSGEPKKLKVFINGEYRESAGYKYMECFNPSTGEVIALAPQCTRAEVEEAINAAAEAFPAWSETPVSKRVQVLYRMKALLDEHLYELTRLCATEHGKKWQESHGRHPQGDRGGGVPPAEAPHLMKGESLMNVSSGYDTVQYHHPIGVFAGIVPWNFPAMIPHGWMAPICIASGNTMVIKAASFTPQCALKLMELWTEAGLPKGVLNVITAGRSEAELLLRHPEVKGVSFVGSTKIGLAHLPQPRPTTGKGYRRSPRPKTTHWS